jgi:FlaA1/EpsC-like NDP-sugar epimerase
MSPLAPAMTPPDRRTVNFITTKTSNHSVATTVTAHKPTERNKTMSTRAYPTSRKLIDLLGDVAIISLTYIVLALLLVNRQALATHIVLYSGMLPLAVILSIGLFIIYGLYTLQYKRFSEIIISLFVSLIAVFFIIMAISFLFNYSYYSRILLISSTVVQFILLIIWKRIWQKYEQSLHPERNVMIIGGEKECRHVYFRMNAQPQLKLHLKHVIMNETEKWRDVADLHDVDCIIICSDVPIQTRADIVYYCMDNDIQPYVIPDSYEIIANGAMLRKIDDIPVFRPRSLHLSIEQRAGKRYTVPISVDST